MGAYNVTKSLCSTFVGWLASCGRILRGQQRSYRPPVVRGYRDCDQIMHDANEPHPTTRG